MISKQRGVVAAGLAAAVAAILSSAAGADASLVGSKVDNFMLADQSGMGHELYYYTASPAIVLVTSADGDKVSERAAKALGKVRETFQGKNVQFMMLDSSLNSKHDAFVGRPGSAELPVLADELQLVGRSLGVTTTGEVFVVETKGWTVAYHGPIDDSFAQKKNKKANLTAALTAVLEGKPVPVAEAAVKGTPVDFPDRQHTAEFAKIDYATQVAPILADKCVVCHTQGGLGPFAMNSYDIVKGFSPMIREVLRTKRMPPYHSDRHGAVWTDIPSAAITGNRLVWRQFTFSTRAISEAKMTQRASTSVEYPICAQKTVRIRRRRYSDALFRK